MWALEPGSGQACPYPLSTRLVTAPPSGSMCVEAENRAWPCGGGWSAARSRQDVCPGPSLLAERTACQDGHPAFPRPLGPDLSAFASAPASQPLLWLFLCLKCFSPRRPGPTPSLHWLRPDLPRPRSGGVGGLRSCHILRAAVPLHTHCLTSGRAEPDELQREGTSCLTTIPPAFPGVHGPRAPDRLSGPERCVWAEVGALRGGQGQHP